MKGSPMLTPDPTDEQLARDWTLSEKDRIEVRRARGAAHRYRFAIQLCVLRNEGRFIDRYDNVPMRIVNHLGRQLHLPAVLLLEAPDRAKTETEQQQRIRQHLGSWRSIRVRRSDCGNGSRTMPRTRSCPPSSAIGRNRSCAAGRWFARQLPQ